MSSDHVTATVADLRVEHGHTTLGIGTPEPRISWRTETDQPGWRQLAYELEVDGLAHGRVESADSILVPWPAIPLTSRQRATLRVRVWGEDSVAPSWSEPLVVEAALLARADWTAAWITPEVEPPGDASSPPPHLRRSFAVHADRTVERARLYVTSAGVHRVELNGQVVGDHVLAPGWSAYKSRLRFDTHDVTELVRTGENVVGAVVADGWWRGQLTWFLVRNVYGSRLGLLAQLEITYADGATDVVGTDTDWRTTTGPIEASDLYDGETYDAGRELAGWSAPGYEDADWHEVMTFAPAVGELVAPPGPPVRRVEELAVREVLTSPSGRTLLDFGQNLVGRVRFTVDGPAGTTVTLRHAEVLEDGELAVAPLRGAKATDRYTLRGGGPETWEPEFTFHGFRYAEVDGWPGALDPAAFTAVVLHSDMARTGTFACSNELLNQLHANVVWGMRGNFVDVPTDCPQRDERLGWTGDLQVFAPTAAYLYDVSGVLDSWLDDLRAEQGEDGLVPVIIPNVKEAAIMALIAAGWSDAATIVPWQLYQSYADRGLLVRQFESMRGWVDHVTARLGDDRRWTLTDFQFGDWLDPLAPEDEPWKAQTDVQLVATGYYARSAQIVGDAAEVLGYDDLADEYRALADEVRAAFRDEYVTPNGRVVNDSAAAYALALQFDMVDEEDDRVRMAGELARVCAQNGYKISTGFLGTPLVLPALSDGGRMRTAFRLLTQAECPSWLYPVTMGATTIWERWDSLLPDGRVNGSGMTSFNHYALGSVADWMHRIIGGLAPAAPGWRHVHVAPVPGPGVSSAHASILSPYGPIVCAWTLDGTTVELRVDIPPNTAATVVRPGRDEDPIDVASGHHEWIYEVEADWVDRVNPRPA